MSRSRRRRRAPPSCSPPAPRSRPRASRARTSRPRSTSPNVGGNCFTTVAGQPARCGGEADGDDRDRRHGHVGLHGRHGQSRTTWPTASSRVDRRPGRARSTRASGPTRHSSITLAPGTYRFVCQAHTRAWRARSPSRARRSRRRADADARPRRRRPPRRRPRRRRRSPWSASGDDHTVTPAPGHAGIKDAAAPRLARAGVKRIGRRRAGALLALRAGDGGDHAAPREDDGRAGDGAGARGHARGVLRTQAQARHATRSSCAPPTRWATAPPAADQDGEGQVTGFRPPADAWSRRDLMRNGFGSLALLCTIASPAALRGGKAEVTSAALRAPGALAVRALPARPAAHPGAAAGLQHAHAGHLRDRDPRGHGRDPARLPDADLRLRGRLSRPDDPRPQGPQGRRAPAQHAAVRVQRAPARRLRPRRARRPPDGRDRRRPLVRLPLPERAGRGDALVPRPRARPHVEDALLRAAGDVRARGRPRGRARAAAGRVRRAARDRRPRLQQGRLVPLRRERRPRLPRRHDPGQRRRLAAHGGAAAQVPPALPQRLQRPLLHAAARPRAARCSRSRATADCSSGRSRARVYLCTRPSASTWCSTSRPTGPATRSSCTTRTARGGTVPIMRFDVVGGGEREEFKVPSRLRAARSRCPAPTRAAAGSSALGTSAWQINGLGFDPTRIDARPRLRQHGDLDLRQPLQPRAPDAHPRLPVPRARALERARSTPPTGSAGRTPSASCPTRPSPCSRGSRPTPASTSSTATRSNTPTRR